MYVILISKLFQLNTFLLIANDFDFETTRIHFEYVNFEQEVLFHC